MSTKLPGWKDHLVNHKWPPGSPHWHHMFQLLSLPVSSQEAQIVVDDLSQAVSVSKTSPLKVKKTKILVLPYVPNFKPSGRRATGGRRLVLTGRTSHHLHPGQRSSQPWWLEPTDSQKPHISLHSQNLRQNYSLLQVATYLPLTEYLTIT